MFWALVLESGKQYSTVVEKSFHLSKAALDIASVRSDNDILSVVFHSDGNEHILCNLSKAHALQESLDLNFMAGSNVVFECKGKGIVHLTGYIVPEEDFAGMFGEEELEDESESDTEIKPTEDQSKKSQKKPQQAVVSPVKRKQEKQLAPDAKKLKQDSDSSDSDSDDDDEDDDDEDDNMLTSFTTEGDSDSDDDDEDDDDEDDDDDDEDDDDDDDDDDDMLELGSEEGEDEEDSDESSDEEEDESAMPNLNKKGQKTPNKTPQKDSGQKQGKTPQQQVKTPQQGKTPKENKTPNNKTPQANAKSDKKQAKTPLTNGTTPKAKDDKNTPAKTPKTPAKILEGGVAVDDIKVGDGPVAKPGKFVNVYYVGRLKNNNKQFDATTQGPGFKFRLGKNEVIKGWDVGVSGMKVGGKRRITCPPEMAYGKKGSLPVIPPNSALVFDVELRSVS